MGAMQVPGTEHCRQKNCQCKGPGVGTCPCVWQTARKVDFSEQLGAGLCGLKATATIWSVSWSGRI